MARFSNSSNNPFIASSERDFDDIHLASAITFHSREAANIAPVTSAISTDHGRPDTENVRDPLPAPKARLKRRHSYRDLAVAVVGGALLIGLMWLIVLKQETYLSLGVTTSCVAAFRLLMGSLMGSLEAVFAAMLQMQLFSSMVLVGAMMRNMSASY